MSEGGYILDCYDEEEEYSLYGFDTTQYLTLEDIDYLRDRTLEISKETESHFRRIIDPSTGNPIKAKVKINLSLYGRTGTENDLGSGEFINYGSWPIKDSWISSDNSAKKKAFIAFSFSSNENAFTTGSLMNWFPYLDHSFSMEPGGLPLYKNKQLIGGIGISGDLPDINEKIALKVSEQYSPPEHIKIDNVRISNISSPIIDNELNSSSIEKFTISVKSRSTENNNEREYFFIKTYENGKEVRFCTHTFTKETIDSLKKKAADLLKKKADSLKKKATDSLKKKAAVLICPTCEFLKK